MENPTISVIVPIYNVGAFLDQCLTSLRNQTFSDLEIICLNDGSTDNSKEIIHAHASQDERLVVVSKQNQGYGATCNMGLELAKGTWISIVEPDDYLSLDAFEKMLSFAASFSNPIDIIKAGWFDVYAWDKPATLYEKKCSLYKRVKTSKKPFSLEENPILIEGHPSIWSALYSKRFIDEKSISFRQFPGAGWADNPFLIDTMAQASNIVYLDECIYHYRVELPNSRPLTDAALKMPSERWIEMTRQLESFGIVSKKVWQAHYIRGFANLNQLAQKAPGGWNNPVLEDCAKREFEIMDDDITLSIGKLSPADKKRYCTTKGISPAKVSKLPYLASLAERAIHKIVAR